MFKRLRNRFILLNMTIISVMTVAAFAVIYVMTYTNTQSENAEKLQSYPIMLTRVLGERRIGGAIPEDYSLSFSVIVDDDGETMSVHSFLDMSDDMYADAVELALDAGRETANISLNGKLWMFRIRELGSIGLLNNDMNFSQIINCRQISFLDITESQKILTRLLITFCIMGFLMLFVIFGISVFFARRAIAPVEIAYIKQKQFIADASHELKTPVAAITANADALLANKHETVESQEKWIDYIKAETDRMGKLVGSLLYLAKTDDGENGGEEFPMNASDVVNNAVLSMEAVAFERGLLLTQSVEPDIILRCDGGKISQVVKILLDNAIKYSDENGTIDITMKQTKHHAVFSISNTCDGIPEEHLPKIFDRFYRSDPSRTCNGSYGLGLSIAKAVIDSMGGQIYAESAPGYAAFTFVLEK